MTTWLESPEHDPYRNLAVEKLLLDWCDAGPTLYLWQNEQTVVIGRNQDAQLECRTDLLESEGGHLARRLSGGGAVYHDLGNLNFSFLAAERDYDVPRQLDVVCRAVESFGLRAVFSGRNDLEIGGRKFSGNAFYERGGRHCHHGTVLVDVDRSAMARYLTVPEDKLASKGVASVQARIVNLRELSPDVTVERMKTALLDAFAFVYGGWCRQLDISVLDKDVLETAAARFCDPAWIYGGRSVLQEDRCEI